MEVADADRVKGRKNGDDLREAGRFLGLLVGPGPGGTKTLLCEIFRGEVGFMAKAIIQEATKEKVPRNP